MPVHVEAMTSEVAMVVGDLPLSEEQLEKLVKLVLTRLREQERATAQKRDETKIRPGVAPGRTMGA